MTLHRTMPIHSELGSHTVRPHPDSWLHQQAPLQLLSDDVTLAAANQIALVKNNRHNNYSNTEIPFQNVPSHFKSTLARC